MLKKLVLLTFSLILAGGVFFLASSDSEVEIVSPINTTSIKENQLSKVLPKEVQENKGYQSLLASTAAEDLTKDLSQSESRELLQKSFETLSACYQTGCGQGPDHDGFYDPSLTVATITLKRVLEATASNFDQSQAKEWLTEEALSEFLLSENKGLRKAALENLFKLKGDKAFEVVLEKTRDLEGYGAGDAVEDLLTQLNEENRSSLIDSIELLGKEKDSFTILEVLERVAKVEVDLTQIKQIGQGLCRFVEVPTEAMNVKAMNHYLSKWAENNGISFNLNSHCL